MAEKTEEIPMSRGVLNEIVFAARNDLLASDVLRPDDDHYIVVYVQVSKVEKLRVTYTAEGKQTEPAEVVPNG